MEKAGNSTLSWGFFGKVLFLKSITEASLWSCTLVVDLWNCLSGSLFSLPCVYIAHSCQDCDCLQDSVMVVNNGLFGNASQTAKFITDLFASMWNLKLNDYHFICWENLMSFSRKAAVSISHFVFLQFLPLCVGARGSVSGWWHFLSWPLGQVPGYAAVSPLHPKPQHSRELDGGVCEHPVRPGQHLPGWGTSVCLPRSDQD